MTNKLEFHRIANVFPLIQGAEFAELVADIRQHGVREPVVLYEGAVLDGRNRYRASAEAGVECPTVEYIGDDPVAFVVSLNIHRRHLDESQRAMVAANIATLGHGGDRSKPAIAVLTQGRAAELLNVSEDSIQRARSVQKKGIEELTKKVLDGTIAVSTASDIARLPKEEQREVVQLSDKEILNRAKAIRAEQAQERRAERIEKIEEISKGNTPLLTPRRYPVIYADPPWRYENPPMGSTSRSIENHYPTMTLEEICALPVHEIAADDAILYMWATAPKLLECMKVLEAWGFDYRTNMVWVKDKIGMGYHARNQHELLLIAKRGEMPPPPPGEQPSSVIHSPRGEHSAKPAEFYEIIERNYPGIGKIELFSRSPRDGWAVWGNQSQEKAA